MDKKVKTKKIKIVALKTIIIALSLLAIFTIAKAGVLTPSASPVATSYTLTDIYTRLTTNAMATEANHDFVPSGSPAATLYTLSQIYGAIPTIDATKVKIDTSYLGVAGSLAPNGGTAAVAGLFSGLTAHLTGDWSLDTGTLDLACNTVTFNGTSNLVATAYDGAGDGTNRWCITNSGDAVAGEILSGKIAWVDGQAVTGTIATRTLSAGSETVEAGYYNATTLSAVDVDLTAANILTGKTIFGIAGSVLAGYTYGDTDASKVLTTATGAGTYNASSLSTATVKKGTAFGVSSTGAYSGYPGTGWSGTAITESACDAQNPTWYWFADGNGDGDMTDAEDGVCIRASTVTSSSWNGSEQMAATAITAQAATAGAANSITKGSAGWTADAYTDMVVDITSGTASGCWGIAKSNTTDTITVYGSWLSSAYASNCGTPDATSVFSVEDDGFALYDNSWIGDWTCSGSFPSGAPSWGSFPTSAKVGADVIALATADCYDGTRDLLPTEASRAVKTGTATAADATTITDTAQSLNTNAWVGQKALITGGTGSGGYGRVESNTATVITVDSWTGGTPDVGSTFAIVYLIPHASYNPTTDVDGNDDTELNGNNGPLTQEVLNNWKGTRLPTASDFFGFCGYNSTDGSGDGSYENTTGTYTADKTFGNYGGQVGRTDEFLDLGNSGNWEWLSEQLSHNSARIAGNYACSNFGYNNVYSGHRFRAVFRP